MSHATGSVITQSPAFALGPSGAAGTTAFTFAPPASPAPGGTKLLILHFAGVNLPGGSRLEVDLGYDTDVFTAADGSDFWTRPVNVYALPGGVSMRLVAMAAGAAASIDKYGRGERHAGTQDSTALSNCDPFLGSSPYTEPKYDPFWFCSQPPDWDNIRCVPTGDIRRDVAASVGMILHVDGTLLSTCSVTLVEPDVVVTAGHCVTNLVEDARSGSIIFGYWTECGGTRPAGYVPLVVKCKEVIAQRNSGGHDFCLMRLHVPAGGLGIPIRQLRHDLPAVGERVFGVHHPNGAVMKLSPPKAAGLSTVSSSTSLAVTVPTGFDVSGGSSGSALFDAAGRVVGMLSNGNPCAGASLSYSPTATMLVDLATPPPPPITRDVVLVVDHSGSMSLPGLSGRPKMAEARDAASLFVQLVQAGTGSKVGLVSFSTTAATAVGLSPVTAPVKAQLVGPPPYVGGAVGALVPNGATSIGAGLDTARVQLSVADGHPHSILLLTDGLQNTPPLIAAVEGGLAGIDIHAIGYGTPGNLDGPLLTTLATNHGGSYVRADSLLRLEKFFAQAFGAIFEAGLLADPEFDLPKDQQSGDPMPFDVCGEETVTVVLGWSDETVDLELAVTTPGGTSVSTADAGVVGDAGRTWRFLRIPLPHGAERDGRWSATAYRPGGGEFPSGGPAVRYFLSVVAAGGPQLTREPQPSFYYTGDSVNPMVRLGYPDGGSPEGATVEVTITGPDSSAGTFLSGEGLVAPLTVGGDVIPSRQATILAAENGGTSPLHEITRTAVPLGGEAGDLRGAFEGGGRFGKELPDVLTVDGDYTVHAIATYGDGCVAHRELLYSWHAEVGVDPDATVVVVSETGTSGGVTTGTVTITPQDQYGNQVGPGRTDGLGVAGVPGTTVTGPVVDNGDGTYGVPVTWPAGSDPGVVVTQPGRPPVVIAPPSTSGPSSVGCLPWGLLIAALLVILVLIILLIVT